MSATYRARALSLKKTRLGEADLIVTFIAEDGCQIRAVAKGARKTKSRFGARVEPFSVVDLLLARGRSLDIITEAECVTSHEGMRVDLDRLAAGSVVADFLDKVSVECQVEERLFGLGTTTLDVMEDCDAAALRGLVVAFLVKGMAMHGYMPQLSACAACAADVLGVRGAAVPGSDAAAASGPGAAASAPSPAASAPSPAASAPSPPAPRSVAFSMEAGGVMCPACAGSDSSVVRVSAAVPRVLSALLRARMVDVCEMALPTDVLRDSVGLLRAFISYHVPARMKALEMYAGGGL